MYVPPDGGGLDIRARVFPNGEQDSVREVSIKFVWFKLFWAQWLGHLSSTV